MLINVFQQQDALGNKNGPFNNVSLPYKPKFGKIKIKIFACTLMFYIP
jgi:hypothetical protein